MANGRGLGSRGGDRIRFPSSFIPHGGGPWPFMQPRAGSADVWRGLGLFLRSLDRTLPGRPEAVLVISAHWEEDRPTVATTAAPPLLFDYYGFPEHTYRLEYPVRGAVELGPRVQELLGAAGVESATVEDRGLDHGVFIPFMLIYPAADVPILQLSLQRNASPERHLEIGRALAPLRDEGVLIVGSGMSYHNLREFVSDRPEAIEAARRFDDWLVSAVEGVSADERDARLAQWASAPGAVASHPRAEHLEPLFVAAGAAGKDRGERIYADAIFGKPISAFRFG
jgi:aromatic ring-opening dioxygenase catalytic subunit (LigB family)